MLNRITSAHTKLHVRNAPIGVLIRDNDRRLRPYAPRSKTLRPFSDENTNGGTANMHDRPFAQFCSLGSIGGCCDSGISTSEFVSLDSLSLLCSYRSQSNFLRQSPSRPQRTRSWAVNVMHGSHDMIELLWIEKLFSSSRETFPNVFPSRVGHCCEPETLLLRSPSFVLFKVNRRTKTPWCYRRRIQDKRSTVNRNP